MARPAFTNAGSGGHGISLAAVALATIPLRLAITLRIALLIEVMPSHATVAAAE